MIEELERLKAKFEGLPAVMPDILQESASALTTLIEDLNLEQLERGERVDGSKLPDYSPASVLIFGKTPGPMNLNHTGAYWRGIRAVVTSAGIELEGTDMKSEMLELRYGDTTGLQQASVDKLADEYLPPEVEPRILKYLNDGRR